MALKQQTEKQFSRAKTNVYGLFCCLSLVRYVVYLPMIRSPIQCLCDLTRHSSILSSDSSCSHIILANALQANILDTPNSHFTYCPLSWHWLESFDKEMSKFCGLNVGFDSLDYEISKLCGLNIGLESVDNTVSKTYKLSIRLYSADNNES